MDVKIATNDNHLISSDDSDEEELPDLFEDYKIGPLSEEIRVGNIVWALFRELYWPALIRHVKKKEKKVTIWYLDSPGKCFKVPFSKIRHFRDVDINKKIYDQVKQSPFKDVHDGIVFKARFYLSRAEEGIKDDPRQFFDPSSLYLVRKDWEKSNANRSEKYQFESDDLPLVNQNKHSDDETSDTGTTIASVMDAKTKKYLEELHNTPEEETDTQLEDSIVSYVTSGNLDKYLVDIKAGKIQSKFHDFYENAREMGISLHMNFVDHVTSKDKLHELLIYLMNLFEKYIQGGKCMLNKYIIHVWLPESINKTFSILKDEANSTSSTLSSKRQLFKEVVSNSTGECLFPSAKLKSNKPSAQKSPVKKLKSEKSGNSKSKAKNVQNSKSKPTRSLKQCIDNTTKKCIGRVLRSQTTALK